MKASDTDIDFAAGAITASVTISIGVSLFGASLIGISVGVVIGSAAPLVARRLPIVGNFSRGDRA